MSTTRKSNEVQRAPRRDGDATRLLILEIAGRLFAERGYNDTTSKSICEGAQTNMAAVNYHFGSRDGLYAAVLKEAHHHVVALDFMQRLAASDLPAVEKLERCVDGICRNLTDIEQWQTRLWARELIAPSPLLAQVLKAEAVPKFDALRQIIAEVIGAPPDEHDVAQSALAVMAPFLILLVMNRDLPGPAQIVRGAGAERVASHMKTYVLGGLEAVRASYESRRRAGRRGRSR